MLIVYQENIAHVSRVEDEELYLYKIEWDDYTIDFVYRKDGEWRARTIITDADLEEIGRLIDQTEQR